MFDPFEKLPMGKIIHKDFPNLESYLDRTMALWFPDRMQWYNERKGLATDEQTWSEAGL
jgi:hypothetical protein